MDSGDALQSGIETSGQGLTGRRKSALSDGVGSRIESKNENVSLGGSDRVGRESDPALADGDSDISGIDHHERDGGDDERLGEHFGVKGVQLGGSGVVLPSRCRTEAFIREAFVFGRRLPSTLLALNALAFVRSRRVILGEFVENIDRYKETSI